MGVGNYLDLGFGSIWDLGVGTYLGFGAWEWLGFGAWSLGFDDMSPVDDVIVVGGGPAGAVAAIVLARAGLRVRLLERATFPRDKLCGDTLNPGAVALLARLALHPADDGLPIHGMLVTGPGAVTCRGLVSCGRDRSRHSTLGSGSSAAAVGRRRRRRRRRRGAGPGSRDRCPGAGVGCDGRA